MYVYADLNRCVGTTNSSPVFKQDPQVICDVDHYTYLDFGAVDPDGDSLVYEITNPLKFGASLIPYKGTYTYQRPVFFWGFPNTGLPFPQGFNLDPNSGLLKFVPKKDQVTILCVKVKEYRNGNLIGEIRRDHTLFVIDSENEKPEIQATGVRNVCAGNELSIDIETYDPDSSDLLTLNYSSDVNDATWTMDTTGAYPSGSLVWMPDTNNIRTLPYKFYFGLNDHMPVLSVAETL